MLIICKKQKTKKHISTKFSLLEFDLEILLCLGDKVRRNEVLNVHINLGDLHTHYYLILYGSGELGIDKLFV